MYFKPRTIRIYLIWDFLILLPIVYFLYISNNEELQNKFFNLLLWPYSFAMWSSIFAGYFLSGLNSNDEVVKKSLSNGLFFGKIHGKLHVTIVKYKLTPASLILIACSVFSFVYWIYKMFF